MLNKKNIYNEIDLRPPGQYQLGNHLQEIHTSGRRRKVYVKKSDGSVKRFKCTTLFSKPTMYVGFPPTMTVVAGSFY